MQERIHLQMFNYYAVGQNELCRYSRLQTDLCSYKNMYTYMTLFT